ELAHLLGAGPQRDRHLSRHAAGGPGSHHRDRAWRLDHCARVRIDRGRPAHAAVADRVTDRVSLCRILPQHAAVGAVVPLVLRLAGTVAACVGDLAEADPERAILYHHDRRGVVHVGPGGRTIAGGHRVAATRTEAGSDGAGPDHDTVLSLRAAADRVPHHHAAADVGIPQHHQEHLGWHYHRPDRADRRGAFDAGILLP